MRLYRVDGGLDVRQGRGRERVTVRSGQRASRRERHGGSATCAAARRNRHAVVRLPCAASANLAGAQCLCTVWHGIAILQLPSHRLRPYPRHCARPVAPALADAPPQLPRRAHPSATGPTSRTAPAATQHSPAAIVVAGLQNASAWSQPPVLTLTAPQHEPITSNTPIPCTLTLHPAAPC